MHDTILFRQKKLHSNLNCPHAATIDDQYALWLELRDPDKSKRGRKRLASKLRDLKSALHFVRLGIEFGINLKLDEVEREIERQIALNGEITLDAALARFALTFTQQTPEDAANYIARHYDDLTLLPRKKIRYCLCQIEICFLNAGQSHEKANDIPGYH